MSVLRNITFKSFVVSSVVYNEQELQQCGAIKLNWAIRLKAEGLDLPWSKGQHVAVFAKHRWFQDGIVETVFLTEDVVRLELTRGMYEDYTVPAGTVKVVFGERRQYSKFVKKEEQATILKQKPEAALVESYTAAPMGTVDAPPCSPTAPVLSKPEEERNQTAEEKMDKEKWENLNQPKAIMQWCVMWNNEITSMTSDPEKVAEFLNKEITSMTSDPEKVAEFFRPIWGLNENLSLKIATRVLRKMGTL